jgi:2-polyprenyl-3-methyl-5-hydroxy-6-metoxy-1,4-benzoquinol methylase
MGRLDGCRVLEVGCGLGLPGITAAVLGADVTLVDAEPAAAAFAAASAAANKVACATRVADLFHLDPAWRFDLVLAAEVAYDRARYPALAGALARHLGAGGVALVADGYRTDTRGFYRAVAALGYSAAAVDVRVVEEGRPVAVRLSVLRPAPDRPRGTAPPPP